MSTESEINAEEKRGVGEVGGTSISSEIALSYQGLCPSDQQIRIAFILAVWLFFILILISICLDREPRTIER